MRSALGIDFGTNSVRCLVVDLDGGEELASSVVSYPSGQDGVIVSAKDPHLARQDPADYLLTLGQVVRKTLATAKKRKGFSPEGVVGIGVDTTGSTPMPVDERLAPLSFRREFRRNPNAMAWLWKDHTGKDEAEEITALARKLRPQYLAKIGGVHSSEWFFSKLLHLARADRKVFDAAAGFIEFADYIPAVLAGKTSSSDAVRGICPAGHKAMYHDDWGGLPDQEFLNALSPAFKGLRRKLYEKAVPAGTPAGALCPEWARKLGLPTDIAISVGAFDAHMGAVGAGIRPGALVKILGTSTCDAMIAPRETALPDIPGLCGIVPDSIVPGFHGIEAGQSAVGDIFYWFVRTYMPKVAADPYRWFQERAAKLKPGQSGLLALDWHNGNRTVLVDQKLTGLVVGYTLTTRPEEVYRALIEATGFGGRAIIERVEEYGVPIDTIITCGGLAEKNALLMQIYADIMGRELKISASAQTCALGAAMFGAIAAGKKRGGFADAAEAQKRLCGFKKHVYRPKAASRRVYDRLYRLYRQVHDAFGTRGSHGDLFPVMKELLAIREEAVR